MALTEGGPHLQQQARDWLKQHGCEKIELEQVKQPSAMESDGKLAAAATAGTKRKQPAATTEARACSWLT